MLVLVQFPLLDLRSFLSAATGRIAKPVFPILDPPTGRGRDWFVRGAGAVRKRYSGDEDQLVGENFYCDASGLIRFDARALEGNTLRERLKAYIAFRRLFWDGRWDEGTNRPARPASLVGRVDVGFGFKPLEQGGELALESAEVEQLLYAVLAEKVKGAWQSKAAPARNELAFIGPQVSATLLRATTSKSMRAQAIANSWWMQSARPSLIVEFNRNDDAKALPSKAKALSLPALWDDCSVRVHFYSLNYQGAPVPVWFVGHSLEYHRRDVRTRLRRCLTRMSAEIAALQALGRMAADPAFQPEIDRSDADYFRHFVTSSLQQIQADRRDGMTQTTMIDLVLAAMEAAAPGDFANLRRVYASLDKRGQHLADRFDSRVATVKANEPLSYRYDFFLAHSTKDVAITDAIYKGLVLRNVRVFLDNRSIEPGVVWPDRLLAAQKASKVTIALVSENSINSVWFKSECTTALTLLNSGLEHALVPILLDASEMPYGTNVVEGIVLRPDVTIDTVVNGLMEALANVDRSVEALANRL